MTETAKKIYEGFKSKERFKNSDDAVLKEFAKEFDGKCITCFAFKNKKCCHLKSELQENTNEFKTCDKYLYMD